MANRRRVLILACDRQAALRCRGVLQTVGYDVSTLSSSADVHKHCDLGQSEAVIVANSFIEPETVLSGLADILNEQDTIPRYINS